MYIVYHFPYSQNARRVVSLMVEANLEFELRPMDMGKGEHMSAKYLSVNPNHQVPTLIDGDIKIHESNAILRYLCVKHRLTGWYPEELPLRAKVEQWLDWNQCRLSPAVVDIVLNSVFLGPAGDRSAVERGCSRLPELWSILDAGLATTPLSQACGRPSRTCRWLRASSSWPLQTSRPLVAMPPTGLGELANWRGSAGRCLRAHLARTTQLSERRGWRRLTSLRVRRAA